MTDWWGREDSNLRIAESKAYNLSRHNTLQAVVQHQSLPVFLDSQPAASDIRRHDYDLRYRHDGSGGTRCERRSPSGLSTEPNKGISPILFETSRLRAFVL